MKKTKRRKLALSIQITILLMCIAVIVSLFAACGGGNTVKYCSVTIEQTDEGAFVVADMQLTKNSVDGVSINVNVSGKTLTDMPLSADSLMGADGDDTGTYRFKQRIPIGELKKGRYLFEFRTENNALQCEFYIGSTHVDGSKKMPIAQQAQASGFIEFLKAKSDELLKYFLEHMRNTGIAVGSAVAIGVPLGIMITRFRKAAGVVLGFANVFQTIPSLAWFGLLISVMGIGMLPAVFVLFLFALLPIIKNTYIGISGVDRGVIEAATGMGMTSIQILGRIEIPLAMPVIMGGIRIATVVNIGSATIAALIGGGGLGNFIFSGIAMVSYETILLGAISASLLALTVDFLLGRLEKALTSKGVSRKQRNEREGAI